MMYIDSMVGPLVQVERVQVARGAPPAGPVSTNWLVGYDYGDVYDVVGGNCDAVATDAGFAVAMLSLRLLQVVVVVACWPVVLLMRRTMSLVRFGCLME